MAKSTDRPKMGDLIKQIPALETPIQEVRPVATKPAEEETKLNFFVPVELAKQIKRYAVDNSTTIKDVSIAAYRSFFEKMSN